MPGETLEFEDLREVEFENNLGGESGVRQGSIGERKRSLESRATVLLLICIFIPWHDVVFPLHVFILFRSMTCIYSQMFGFFYS